MTSPLEAARRYRARGWAPIPIARGQKNPNRKGWQNERHAEAELPRVFAGDGNVGVLLGDPSGGLVDCDCDTREAVEAARVLMPRTGAVYGRTGARWTHWLYVVPGLETRKFADPIAPKKDAMLLELRSTGAQSVFPPSLHPTGERYGWEQEGAPAAVDPVLFVQAAERTAAAALLARYWPEGVRHEAALALGGWLLRAGWALEDAQEIVEAVAHAAGDPEWRDRVRAVADTADTLAEDKPATGYTRLKDRIDERVLKAVAGWLGLDQRKTEAASFVVRAVDPETGEVTERRYAATEVGNAELFADTFRGRVVYVDPWERWMVFDGQRWAEDRRNAAQELAIASNRAHPDPEWAHKSQSRQRVHATLNLARGKLAAEPAEFDTDAYLLNTPSGTVDLRTGELRPHRAADMQAKITAVAYDPEGACPLFERFLEDIFQGDAGLIEFVLRLLGYALTGDVSEQVLGFFYGFGSNGKSTLLTLIHDMLGDYAHSAGQDFLVEGFGGDQHPTNVADLFGKRFVITVEPNHGKPLNEALVKHLTGGDPITARRMHQNNFTFRPQHKVFISANHKPKVVGDDHGIWRRIRMVPFEVKYEKPTPDNPHPAHPVDEDLADKLMAEAPAILGLLVRKAVAWRKHRLGSHPKVVRATEQYKGEMDWLGTFVEDCCAVAPGERAVKSGVYDRYRKWCEETGERPTTKRDFGRKLRERLEAMGHAQPDDDRKDGQRMWFGLRTLSQSEIESGLRIQRGGRGEPKPPRELKEGDRVWPLDRAGGDPIGEPRTIVGVVRFKSQPPAFKLDGLESLYPGDWLRPTDDTGEAA